MLLSKINESILLFLIKPKKKETHLEYNNEE